MTKFLTDDNERGFFDKNKLVALIIIVACLLFVFVFFVEKSQVIIDMVPVMRGEVSLDGGFSITTIRNQYPILIKKDDPIVGSRLRFSGDVKSLFSEISIFLAPSDGVVVEVGSHFGYNAINIAKKMKSPGKYYAFEPNAGVFSCLRKSIVLNDIDKIVQLKNVAIFDQENVIPITDCLSPIKNPDGTFTKPRSIVANCDTLDKELADEPRPVSLLMADVAGSEFCVLKGAQKIIENSPDIKMVLAFDRDDSMKSADVKFELQKLKNLGFNFYLVDSFDSFMKADIEEIMSRREGVLVIMKDKLNLNF
jgi:FkbM family methyltransferase